MKKMILLIAALLLAAIVLIRGLGDSPANPPETPTNTIEFPPVAGDTDSITLPAPSVPLRRVLEFYPGPAMRVTEPAREDVSFGGPDLAGRFQDLADRAQAGDSAAARELGLNLHACLEHAGTLATFERAESPAVLQQPEAVRAAQDAQTMQHLESDFFKARSAMCDGLTAEQLGSWFHWLERATSLGDLAAAEMYYQFGLEDDQLRELAQNPHELLRFRETALRGLEAAARRCNPGAIRSLSNNYWEGAISGADPSRAYAYQLISDWATGQTGTAPRLPNMRPADLSNEEISQAFHYAQQAFSAYCQ